jgi:hypothetical protein
VVLSVVHGHFHKAGIMLSNISFNLQFCHQVEWLVDKMLLGEQGRGMLSPVETVSL